MSIQILQSGLLTTVQDLGRTGYQQYGVPVSGAMDRFSCQLANLLVGNADHAAVLECTLLGPSLRFEEDSLIAITGADMNPVLNGQPVPMNTAIRVSSGDEVVLSAAQKGCRSYLAISGGIDVPLQMGSRSTYLKAGIGGYQGRKLQAGDRLSLLSIQDGQLNYEGYQWKVSQWKGSLGNSEKVKTIRILLGPQDDEFTAKGMETFLSSRYTITDQSDRMGYRLQNEDPSRTIQHLHDGNIVSDGMALGSIQVPPSGQPIIMLADRQTTGGYPKIATVCSVDLKILAQSRPGDLLAFQTISIEEAQQLCLQEKALLKEIEEEGRQWAHQSHTLLCSHNDHSIRVLGSSKDYQIRVNGRCYHVKVEEQVSLP